MKTSLVSIASLMLALTACGNEADSGSTVADTALTHKIQPLGSSTSCIGSGARTVRDHRTDPVTVYTEYFLAMKGCAPAESTLQIQMLGGQQWVGGQSYVTIKKNGLCLTNPATNTPGGVDKGEALWKPCIQQLSSTPERYRQQWLITFNNNNAMRIETHAAVSLGLPNAQVQCLDRQDPVTVKRVACTLNNWQIVRAN